MIDETRTLWINKWLRLADRASDIYLDKKLSPLGMNESKFAVFVYIARYESATQGEVADITLYDKSTITRIVNSLEKDGLVRRVVDMQDKRFLRLYLTDKGKEIVPEVLAVVSEWNRLLMRDFEGQEEEIEDLLFAIAKTTRQYASGASDEEIARWEGLVRWKHLDDPKPAEKS